MTAAPVIGPLTVEEFLALRNAEDYELVDGYLVERIPMGAPASRVAARITHLLESYCDAHPDAGWVLVQDTNYRMTPRATLTRPDVSFLRRERFPSGELPEGPLSLAPDLAVEAVSPTDTADEVEGKVRSYLAAGVSLVWVAFHSTRSVHVRRPDGSATILNESQEITGESVLPGFRCPVRDVFVRL